jgi:hypothetical protein
MDLLAPTRARRATIAALVLAFTACDNQINPTSPAPHTRQQDIQTQVDTTFTFSISDVSLSSKTVVIDGSPVAYTTTVVSLTQSYKGLSVRSFFVQQQVRHQVGDQGVPCAFGSSTCTYTNSVQATGLVPGAALFEQQLVDPSGVVVSTRDVGVTLVSGVTISGLIPTSANLVVGGPLSSYGATIQNPGSAVSGVAVQGWIIQSGANSARRAAGGQQVVCGSGSGVLPTGKCSTFGIIVASNSTSGTGTLVPGPATFELDLIVNGAVVSQTTAGATIVTGATIASLTMTSATSDTLLLEASGASFTTTLKNVGSNLSGLSVEGWINQGTARRLAVGTLVSCGNTVGVLPNGSCVMSLESWPRTTRQGRERCRPATRRSNCNWSTQTGPSSAQRAWRSTSSMGRSNRRRRCQARMASWPQAGRRRELSKSRGRMSRPSRPPTTMAARVFRTGRIDSALIYHIFG